MDDSIFLEHIENFSERDHIYEAGDKIIKHAMNFRPTISYNYLNFDLIEDYCFNHSEFTSDDFKIYFKKIKEAIFKKR